MQSLGVHHSVPMVSVVENEPFSSLDPKGGTQTDEQELDYLRQRFQSMKLVLKELQQQVIQYKVRCAGVDTVALLLKESKQEIMKLTKQKKAFETAVANLQNRLITNGLSSSLNIEETELFVPGASQQILDNLARENARLRSMLKNNDGQSGRSSEEIDNLKASLENLEAENNRLKSQILELENVKQTLRDHFEDTMAQIKKVHETEKSKLEEELDKYQHGNMPSSWLSEDSGVSEFKSKTTQTFEVEPSRVDEIRQSLKLLTDQCIALDLTLETVHKAAKDEVEKQNIDKQSGINEEDYMELEHKYKQVTQMNQHWRAYNQSQEQQIHGLLARLTELELFNKERERLKNMFDAKEIENDKLRKEIDILTKEACKLRSHPNFDASIVEILKQQIQVCTEDFNTERKDREQAVNRAKQLQDELIKISNENDNLKKELNAMRRSKNTPEQDNREGQLWSKASYFTARGGQIPPSRIQFVSKSSLASPPSMTSSLSSSSSPVFISPQSTPSASDRSFHSSSLQNIRSGFESPVEAVGNRQPSSHKSSYATVPRVSRTPRQNSAFPDTSQNTGSNNNASVMSLSRKSDSLGKIINSQTDLTCPRCSKEFTEDQQSELIHHINTCKD